MKDTTDNHIKRGKTALPLPAGRLSAILNSVAQAVVYHNAEGMPVFVNSGAISMFGSDPTGLTCRTFVKKLKLRYPDGRPVPFKNFPSRRALRGEKVENERYVFTNARGEEVSVLVSCNPFGGRGAPEGAALILDDITKWEQLLRARKLESVGILAGGIAHDFNNLLTAVMGYLGIARARIKPEDILYTLLDKAQKVTGQAAELTQRLITFARGGEPLMKTSSIGGLIRESVGLSLSGSNLESRISLPDDLWPVRIDEAQMRQVFRNIIQNAREAMPAGGCVEVSAENIRVKKDKDSQGEEGRQVGISIRDHGRGIDPDQLHRIFDPYFSTKERGTLKGMGLGLSVCHSIITRHGGSISAESVPEKGTAIHISLPASGGRTVECAKRPSRVLVMDDEEILLTIFGEILNEGGYDVILAKDGAAAVTAYKSARDSKEPFDVVLLDLIIPGGKGGVETLKELRTIDKNVRAVLFSAYLDDPAMSDFMESGFIAVVPKPFTAETLIETVSRVIGITGL